MVFMGIIRLRLTIYLYFKSLNFFKVKHHTYKKIGLRLVFKNLYNYKALG